MRFAIFPVHLSKLLRLPRKSDARSYEVLHLSRKIISANLKIWGSKMQPSQEISARTSWWTCLLYCACHGKCIFADPMQMPHACHGFWKCYKTLTFCSLLTRCNPLRLPRETTSEPPKVVRTWCVLYILTSKCASRHNGVHFFDISTSKSAPKLKCFLHFDLEMCFAPQRRAILRHLNFQRFQKWSEHGVFCTFWLRNVLRATTACTFSTAQLLKVLRSWGAFYILT